MFWRTHWLSPLFIKPTVVYAFSHIHCLNLSFHAWSRSTLAEFLCSQSLVFLNLLIYFYNKKKKKKWSSLQFCSFGAWQAWAWLRLTVLENLTSIHYPSSTFIKLLLGSKTRSPLQRTRSFSARRYITFIYIQRLIMPLFYLANLTGSSFGRATLIYLFIFGQTFKKMSTYIYHFF